MNKLSKQEILKGLEDIKQLECNPEYKTKVINGMLDLYNIEVEYNNQIKELLEHTSVKELILLKYKAKKLNKIEDLRDSLDMFAYSDVIEKLDEILED